MACVSILPNSFRVQLPSMKELATQMNYVASVSRRIGSEVAFCHLDVNPSNVIIVSDTEDGEQNIFTDILNTQNTSFEVVYSKIYICPLYFIDFLLLGSVEASFVVPNVRTMLTFFLHNHCRQ